MNNADSKESQVGPKIRLVRKTYLENKASICTIEESEQTRAHRARLFARSSCLFMLMDKSLTARLSILFFATPARFEVCSLIVILRYFSLTGRDESQ